MITYTRTVETFFAVSDIDMKTISPLYNTRSYAEIEYDKITKSRDDVIIIEIKRVEVRKLSKLY